MEDFTFHPSSAPDHSLDSGCSIGQVFAGGRVLKPVRFPCYVFFTQCSSNISKQCSEMGELLQSRTDVSNKENSGAPNMKQSPTLSPTASPATPKLVKPIRMVQPVKHRDDLPAMVDLVNWRNPPAAVCAMIGGAAICGAGHWLFRTNAPFLSSKLPRFATLNLFLA
jgi:hypothetical protein